MNRVSQLVNNFLNNFVATAGAQLPYRRGSLPPTLNNTASLPSAPRFRWRERGVILSTRPHPRKRFVKKV